MVAIVVGHIAGRSLLGDRMPLVIVDHNKAVVVRIPVDHKFAAVDHMVFAVAEVDRAIAGSHLKQQQPCKHL